MKRFAIQLLGRLHLAKPVERWTRPMRALLRRRTMRRFYQTLVRPGDLVFDIGANVGDWSEVYLLLGTRVVAVEPQGNCAALLRTRFKLSSDLTVVQAALAAREGTAEITLCQTSSQMATMSPAFITQSRYSNSTWAGTETVRTTTLDALIAEHGLPVFCKIDVEGFEAEVLGGLSHPIPLMSFEFFPEFERTWKTCLDRIQSIGDYEFNATLFPNWRFQSDRWITRVELETVLRDAGSGATGDIYVRLADPLSRYSGRGRG